MPTTNKRENLSFKCGISNLSRGIRGQKEFYVSIHSSHISLTFTVCSRHAETLECNACRVFYDFFNLEKEVKGKNEKDLCSQ